MSYLLRLAMTLVVCSIGLASAPALAQPGQTMPTQPPPGPGPYAQDPYYGSPPNLHLLTDEERELLYRGEIRVGQYIAGGIVGSAMGFGIGHAVQGRWTDNGWLFTVGESASLVALFTGVADCWTDSYYHDRSCNESLIWGGLLAFAGLRIWENIDVWVGPPAHNRRVRAARGKAYGQPPPRYGFYVLPRTGGEAGGVAGLTLRF